MKITSKNGNSFTFKIERYEHTIEELSSIEDDPDDEDFDTGRYIIVSHEFENADGRWSGEFPTMDTVELARFIDWIDAVRRQDFQVRGVYFTERVLEFGLNESNTSLRVLIDGELLPPWVKSPEYVILEFPLDELNLEEVLISLREQASAFPGLPPRPTLNPKVDESE